MKKLFLTAVIFLFAASAFAQSETGRYLVPVKKSDLIYGRESVCVLEQCYYIVDKIGAERSVSSGEAKVYYPEIQRKLYAAPNDPHLSKQWHLKSSVYWESGWERIKDLPSAGDVPVVAVIDTGIIDHEDLPFTSLYGGIAYEASNVDPVTNGVDRDGHGTHVAGIVGALTNNNIGVSSASGGKVRVMSIRAAVPCSDDPKEACIGTTAVIDAIGKILVEKLAGTPIIAVNMSFGGDSMYKPEFDAVEDLLEHGIIAVVAAGNDRKDIDDISVTQYPAEYDLPNIIAVAAVSSNLNLTVFSNYGYSVNIAAPGDSILSLGNSARNQYVGNRGTSMAAPFIAGLLGAGAALYNKDMASETYPDITPAQLMNILYDTASVRQFYNPINGGRLANVDAFFKRIEECREDAKTTGYLCTLAEDSYPIEDKIVPPAPPPAPAPETGWGSDKSGGCSLAAGDKGGLPSFLLLLVAIPLFIAARRKLKAR
jgi:subtilisin family serine protease